MQLARPASWVHKWLALLVGVQVVLWVVSGFFSLFACRRMFTSDANGATTNE